MKKNIDNLTRIFMCSYMIYYWLQAFAIRELLMSSVRYGHAYVHVIPVLMILGFFATLSILFEYRLRLACLLVAFSLCTIHYMHPYSSFITIALIVFYHIVVSIFATETSQDSDSRFKFTMIEGPWRTAVGGLIAISLFTSGISKLQFSAWTDGVALKLACYPESLVSMVFPNYCDWDAPTYFKFMTYAALCFELSCIFYFFKSLRRWVWLSEVLLCLGILTHMALNFIIFPLLICLIWMFDVEWIPKKLLLVGKAKS